MHTMLDKISCNVYNVSNVYFINKDYDRDSTSFEKVPESRRWCEPARVSDHGRSLPSCSPKYDPGMRWQQPYGIPPGFADYIVGADVFSTLQETGMEFLREQKGVHCN